MSIQLTSEDEKLIRKRLRSGVFRSVEEVIHDALASQDTETAWLEENKEAINEKIARASHSLTVAKAFPARWQERGFSSARPIG